MQGRHGRLNRGATSGNGSYQRAQGAIDGFVDVKALGMPFVAIGARLEGPVLGDHLVHQGGGECVVVQGPSAKNGGAETGSILLGNSRDGTIRISAFI